VTNPTNSTNAYTVPSVSITTARTGASSKANALGMDIGFVSEPADREWPKSESEF